MRKQLVRGLYGQQLGLADNFSVNAVFAHQRGCVACCIKRLLVSVKVGNAALKPVVLNGGCAHHVFERAVAVRTECHQLLHVALKSSVIALGQKLQPPQPLPHVQLGPEKQRSLVAEHPFQGFERRLPVGPRLAIAD